VTPTNQRQELGEFLQQGGDWRILKIMASPQIGHIFDVAIFKQQSQQLFWRIFAIGPADFLIRPPDRATLEGGPAIHLSPHGPLQQIYDGDGEEVGLPRRFQTLKLDQSWIVAERFEIEALSQTSSG
jgi:hypothetical protein